MIVLDTHVLVWMIDGGGPLSQGARARIDAEADGGVLVPAICLWELALLETRGHLKLSDDLPLWVKKLLAVPQMRLAELTPEIAIETVRLPTWEHRDPADRMIVATARQWQAPLLTVDREILTYAATGALETVDARR